MNVGRDWAHHLSTEALQLIIHNTCWQLVITWYQWRLGIPLLASSGVLNHPVWWIHCFGNVISRRSWIRTNWSSMEGTNAISGREDVRVQWKYGYTGTIILYSGSGLSHDASQVIWVLDALQRTSYSGPCPVTSNIYHTITKEIGQQMLNCWRNHTLIFKYCRGKKRENNDEDKP